ncbi:histidine kinase [uncultured Jatrophihabitans sp.]|uniref:histidine kinase n=1 Tax=uncultured Jatrophihabitans sp. TaxID=1610747 RepID=UPI0035CC634A
MSWSISWSVLADGAAALSAAVAGLVLLARGVARVSGWLLLAAAAALPFVDVEQPSSAFVLTASLLLGGLAPLFAATAGVSWPLVRSHRVETAAITTALVGVVVVGGLLPAMLFDPVRAGCYACPANLVEVHAADGAAEALERAGQVLTLVWAAVAVGVGLARRRRASQLARRLSWPQLAAGAGIAALSFVGAVHGLGLPLGEADPEQHGIWLVQAGFVTLLAAGALFALYLQATAGRRMARIVLRAVPDPAEVLASLRNAVADPGLAVAFVRADGSLVDLDGGPAVPPADRTSLLLSREGVVFADVRYDPRLATSAWLVRSSAAAAGLALEYLAARARLRAELRTAAAVRARIVADGDTERRRLERNLHDGAQQRLIALGMSLAVSSAATGVVLEAEHAELDAALDELRDVAHGLFPASLQDGGVGAALRELGDSTPCPLVVSDRLAGAVPAAFGMAAYTLVGEVVQLHPANAALAVQLDGGESAPARITLTTALTDAADLRARVMHVGDRFVASGGDLNVLSGMAGDAGAGAAGLVVEGWAPCGS